MFTNFNDVVDNLRIINEKGPDGPLYKCTITSRRCHRTTEAFRQMYYDTVSVQTEGIMEYHSKSVKVHMHGYACVDFSKYPPNQLKFKLQEVMLTEGDFTITLHNPGICKVWNKYCRKQIEHTYEYNDIVKKGIWFRFHKHGRRTRFAEPDT